MKILTIPCLMACLTISAFLLSPFPSTAREGKPDTDSEMTVHRKRSHKAKTLAPQKKNGNAPVDKGLFHTQKVEEEWYLEIPDSLLGKPMLVTARYVSTPANTRKYGGELFNQQVVYWELAPNGKLMLRSQLEVNVADSLDAINRAVRTANENPIIAAFTVESHAGQRYRIKVNNFLLEDNPALSPSKSVKQAMGMANLNRELSYVESIRTYPRNTEFRLVKTWTSTGSGSAASYATGKVTLHINLSFLRLPDRPMRRRLFDPRVGYFTDRHVTFSDDQQKVEERRFITRWRLEPKDSADLERWKKGELVEPKKQIVYYIDPATPKPWRKYLIQGVNDWQAAFEQAGFKNAIVGKEWPENDSTMSMEDARFSCIRYLASDIPNAYGPQVHDPRTGEILESHICWYHNVMSLVHDWYFVQASTLDEAARQMKYDEELMGQLIRFVSSHEVGHSLGLRHNFGSSSLVPVDSLRNREWVEKHGHTPSIMDYARFNYVAQPEDGISREGIFPRINDYDKWAIQWGYMLVPNAYDEESDHWEMEPLVRERLKENPRLWFGDGETNRTKDPRCQTEDLGDDAVKASEYGLQNLKREIRKLPEWTYQGNDIYNRNLPAMYDQILAQFQRYANHVACNVGGIMADQKTVDEEGPVYRPVSRDRQLECLDYLDRHIFHLPEWLTCEPYMLRIATDPQSGVQSVARRVLTSLLSSGNLSRLNSQLTADELLPLITRKLFTDAPGNTEDARYRRMLQAHVVDIYVTLFKEAPPRYTYRAALLAELRYLSKWLKTATDGDVVTRNHRRSLADAIERALETK